MIETVQDRMVSDGAVDKWGGVEPVAERGRTESDEMSSRVPAAAGSRKVSVGEEEVETVAEMKRTESAADGECFH